MKHKYTDGGGDFQVVDEGVYNAVVIDVVPKGFRSFEYNGEKSVKHKTAIVWQLDAEFPGEAGGYYHVWQNLTTSIHKRSRMGQVAEALGIDVAAMRDAGEFDPEFFLGVTGLVTIQHNSKGDKTYANVANVSALPKSMPPLKAAGDYVRMAKREDWVYPVKGHFKSLEEAAWEMPPEENGAGQPIKAESNFAAVADEDELPF